MNEGLSIGETLILLVGFFAVMAVAVKQWERYENKKLSKKAHQPESKSANPV